MRFRALLLLLSTGACGGTSSPRRATAPDRPDHDTIRRAVLRHWDASPEDLSIAIVPGKFGEPGFFVDAIAEPEDGAPQRRQLIFSEDLERLIIAGAATSIAVEEAEEIVAWSAHDLDRDGVDELIEDRDADELLRLRVHRLDGTTLHAHALDAPCAADWAIDGDALVVIGDCIPDGEARYRLAPEGLVTP